MTHLPRMAALATTAALALSLSLAACSSGSSDADTASAASDQAVTATADTDAATAADADDNAAVPDGFTLVEVPDYGISVAVPSDWDTLTSANTSDAELVGRIAQALDDSEDEVIDDLEDTPLTSVDTSADTDLAPYLFVTRIDGQGALPTEEQMRSLADSNEADVTGYEETTSGSGADAATITLSASVDGTHYYLSAFAVSDGDDAYFASVIVSDSEEQLKEISDAMLASL